MKMEIERINENTIKFYISYVDIEDRGFEREEIWYSRERSEQLFWQMMEEVNYQEDFTVEGPLWIQVQALEKGLEVIVTKAQMSKNGENIELSVDDENTIDIPVDERIENMLENKFGSNVKKSNRSSKEDEDEDDNMSIIVKFNDFEDVIQLSHYFQEETEITDDTLYHYNGNYYLQMEFLQEALEVIDQENIISQVLEFAKESAVTIYLLEEYGKVIFENNTLSQVRKYFPAKL